METAHRVPKDDADRDRDVEGVFCTVLRNLKAYVRGIHDTLLYAFHLIAEDKGVVPSLFQPEFSQHGGIFRLLHAYNGISRFTEFRHCIGCLPEVLPIDAELCAKCGFVYLCRWRHGANAAQIDFSDAKSVAGPESGAYIVLAPDIVEYQYNR